MNKHLSRWLSGFLLLSLTACSHSAPPVAANANSPSLPSVQRLTITGHAVLPRADIDGIKLTELSGLAWDEDEQLLYAVSDRGKLFHIKLTLQGGQITAAEAIKAVKLRNKKGKKLKWRDTEGLVALNASNGKRGDTQLVVAVEGRPNLLRFDTQGKQLGSEKLHKALQDRHQYRKSNNGLESVTYHPHYGFLTAPELALKGLPENLHTVYAHNRQWSFMAYPAKNSSISGMEVMPDGSLLVLERAWSGLGNPMVISLRRVDLKACSKEGACQAENLKVLSSILMVDNYEGLTHIKEDLYMMVSDDGKHDLLRTLLTSFRIHPQ